MRYATAVRHLAVYDLDRDRLVNRFDLMLLKVLRDGPKEEVLPLLPVEQFTFCYDPKRARVKQIGRALRDMADEIEAIKGGK